MLVLSRLAALALCAAVLIAGRPARAAEIIWPVPVCDDTDIAAASPAPFTNDSGSLSHLPFLIGLVPATAAVLVSLDGEGAPTLRCVEPDWDGDGLELAAITAVAGMTFSAPQVANRTGKGGLYLVRVSTLFGLAWVHAPPRQTLMPICPGYDTWPLFNGIPPNAPKPEYRVNPTYPAQAESEGIEGSVTIVLETFANGAVSPVCLAHARPAGWFEVSALDALAQWRFRPSADFKLNTYTVTIKFLLE